MNKIKNKLILIPTILTFIFGLFLASPVYAQRINRNGYYEQQYIPINYYPTPTSNPTNPVVIAGCEERTVGFSTTTGQSCYGNYINNPTTIVKNTDNTTSSVSNTTKKDNSIATNDSYGSLTANALFGSNSFMPSGLIQWIFFAVLILAIIFMWKYVHRSEEKYKAEPMKHA